MLYKEENCNFINGQGRPEFADIPYGRSTIGKAGCEAIACYNAMLLLGRPVPFEEVRGYFEKLFRRGLGWAAGGMLGATPIEMRLFLREQGMPFIRMHSVRSFNKKAARGKLPPGVIIVSYWNKPILKYGYHTVAVDCRKAAGCDQNMPQLTVYNRFSDSAGPERIGALSELMNGNWRFISGFYIPNTEYTKDNR